jgi:hypothetical protein
MLSALGVLSFGIIGSLSADQATSCPKGMALCNGTHCTDLNSDESACGSCGNICASGYSCLNGTCGCLDGETSCNGMCINTKLDYNNCGECGISCSAGQYCSNGTCTCTNGNLLCSGICIDKDFDDNNCGECGNTCASGSFCSEGKCWAYSDVIVGN